jgi:hypothetical protein
MLGRNRGVSGNGVGALSNRSVLATLAILVVGALGSATAEEALFQSRRLTDPGEYPKGIEGPAVDAAGNLYGRMILSTTRPTTAFSSCANTTVPAASALHPLLRGRPCSANQSQSRSRPRYEWRS